MFEDDLYADPQHAVFLFCIMAQIRIAARSADSGKKRLLVVKDVDLKDFVYKVYKVCEAIDDYSTRFKLGDGNKASSWSTLVGPFQKFDPGALLFDVVDNGYYSFKNADETLYVPGRQLLLGPSGWDVGSYGNSKEGSVRNSMRVYRDIMKCVGMNVDGFKGLKIVRGKLETSGPVDTLLGAFENVLYDFDTPNADTSCRPVYTGYGNDRSVY